jgi:hypothetical protein
MGVCAFAWTVRHETAQECVVPIGATARFFGFVTIFPSPSGKTFTGLETFFAGSFEVFVAVERTE